MLAVLNRMDALFEGFFEWLEDQYDPLSGGFYFARSSKESGAFTPDIESTAQALNILDRCGLLGRLDSGMRARLVRFFQQKQDPSSGYFYDDDPHMKEDEVMVGRAIAYSVHALSLLGEKPLYRLPGGANAAPAYMASPEEYARWLRSVALCNSWRGCDRLCNSAPYIAELAPEAQDRFLQEAFSYFDSIQDPESGLWGEGSRYVRISGTFKLLTFYRRFRTPIPRERRIYETILHTLREDVAKDMCYIRNPIDLLSYMKEVRIPEEELVEIVDITTRNLAKLKRPDGGFSRELHRSPSAPNVAQVKEGEFYPDMPKPVHLSLGLVEGDMNAGTQAVLIRSLCRQLAKAEPKPLPVKPDLFAKYYA